MTDPTLLFVQARGGDDPVPSDAMSARSLITAVLSAGVIGNNDLLVGPRGTGANRSVDVHAGLAAIDGTDVAHQGTYLGGTWTTVNVPLAAAPGSGSRTDLIYARAHDGAALTDSTYAIEIGVVTGSTSDYPDPPALPTSAIPLAEVVVHSSTTAITAGLITDVRPFAKFRPWANLPAYDVDRPADTIHMSSGGYGIASTASVADPARPVNISAEFDADMATTGATTLHQWDIGISTDGGATYTYGLPALVSSANALDIGHVNPKYFLTGITATGAIHAQARYIRQVAVSGNYKSQRLVLRVEAA